MIPRVSVVVVHYRGAQDLRACVDSLLSQDGVDDLEIVVVDNASQDRAPQALGSAAAAALPSARSIRLVLLPQNRGFAAGANAGAAAASGERILFLNPDAVAEPGCVRAMAAALDAGADLATARIALAENPDILDTCGHRLYPDGLNLCRGRGEPAAGCFEEGDEVLLFSGAAVMFSRAAWEKAGGFDEGFFGYGEDAELGLRAARLGLRCRYVPDARVRHRVGGAFGSHTLRKVFLVERNRARVAVVHLPADWLAAAPLWTLLRHAMLAAAGLGGRGLAAGLPAGRRALLPFVVAAAHGAGWLRLPGSLRRRAALARRVRAEGGLDAGRWRERLAEARAGPRELMRRGRI